MKVQKKVFYGGTVKFGQDIQAVHISIHTSG